MVLKAFPPEIPYHGAPAFFAGETTCSRTLRLFPPDSGAVSPFLVFRNGNPGKFTGTANPTEPDSCRCRMRSPPVRLVHLDVSRPQSQQPVLPQVVADPRTEPEAREGKGGSFVVKACNGNPVFEKSGPGLRQFKGMKNQEMGKQHRLVSRGDQAVRANRGSWPRHGPHKYPWYAGPGWRGVSRHRFRR